MTLSHTIQNSDSEISSNSDNHSDFSVSRESPREGHLCFGGGKLGGWLYFSIPRVFLKREK